MLKPRRVFATVGAGLALAAPAKAQHTGGFDLVHRAAPARPATNLANYVGQVATVDPAIAPASFMVQFAGPLSPGSFEATLGTGPIAQALGDSSEEVVSSAHSVSQKKSSKTQTNAKSLQFRPTEEVRGALYQRIVRESAVSDPAGSRQLASFLETPNLFGQIEEVLAPIGLTTTNLADAFAIWWIGAWNGAQGTNDIVDRATAQAVKRQSETALLSTPGIASLTNAQKQEMAEAYLIQAALIDASVDGAKRDPAMLEQVKLAIVQGAKASGMDLSKVTLTEEGFVPATRTTDANDAGYNATPDALAANEGAALIACAVRVRG